MAGLPDLVAEAVNCQVLYRKWLDNNGDKIDSELLLDDYLSATQDLLERITGQRTPPTTLEVPPRHGTQAMFDADCRCWLCREAGRRDNHTP